MKLKLSFVLEQVSKEKNIDVSNLIKGIEEAVLNAAKKKYPDRELEAQYNDETGEVEVFEFIEVVDKVGDSYKEISYAEAKEIDPDIEIGDYLGLKIDSEEFGRIAVQQAKSTIINKIREAEKEAIYNEYKDRIGELLIGFYQRSEHGNIIINLGRTEGIIPRAEQSPSDRFKQGERIKTVIVDVKRESKGPQIILSRTHPKLLMRLFELEVPEIYENLVEIKGAARDPGNRAKLAVYSKNIDIDPVGACVGVRGSRVNGIVRELGGERIDIVRWDPDPTKFVINALSPAQISKIILDEENRVMEIIVPNENLSLAIGKRGQNVKLAAKLTGYRIDIKSESQSEEEFEKVYNPLKERLQIDFLTMRILYDEGFRTLGELIEADADDIADILEIEVNKAYEIIDTAQAIINEQKESESNKEETEKEETTVEQE
jgi:N utilization substance protein A